MPTAVTRSQRNVTDTCDCVWYRAPPRFSPLTGNERPPPPPGGQLSMSNQPGPNDTADAISRRDLLAGAAGALGAAVIAGVTHSETSAQQAPAQDTTKQAGAFASDLGTRAP